MRKIMSRADELLLGFSGVALLYCIILFNIKALHIGMPLKVLIIVFLLKQKITELRSQQAEYARKSWYQNV